VNKLITGAWCWPFTHAAEMVCAAFGLAGDDARISAGRTFSGAAGNLGLQGLLGVAGRFGGVRTAPALQLWWLRQDERETCGGTEGRVAATRQAEVFGCSCAASGHSRAQVGLGGGSSRCCTEG
jgi:hypothetical protein